MSNVIDFPTKPEIEAEEWTEDEFQEAFDKSMDICLDAIDAMQKLKLHRANCCEALGIAAIEDLTVGVRMGNNDARKAMQLLKDAFAEFDIDKEFDTDDFEGSGTVH